LFISVASNGMSEKECESSTNGCISVKETTKEGKISVSSITF
jgi:hypothetical protein